VLDPAREPILRFDYSELIDTFDIPSEHSLVFRVRLNDRPRMDWASPGGALGRWMFHCHITYHATLGMISELVVLEP
jgi:FtsP/CotA-like multicopper oxidase with cupredoxin domain